MEQLLMAAPMRITAVGDFETTSAPSFFITGLEGGSLV
jgi:hypothetical protein